MVYCVEQADNPGIDLNNITLTANTTFTLAEADGLLQGIKKLETKVGKRRLPLFRTMPGITGNPVR